MPWVYHRQAEIEGLDHSVMRYIAGDDGLGDQGGGFDEVAPRAGHDRQLFDEPVRVSRNAQTRRAEHVGGSCIQHVQGPTEHTHTSDRRHRPVFVATKRLDVTKVVSGGESVGRSSRSGVEIGMGDDNADPGANQAIRPSFRRATCQHAIDRAEQQGVVGQEQVDRVVLQNGHHGLGYLMTDRHRCDFRRRIAEMKTDWIPESSRLGVGQVSQLVGYHLNSGHEESVLQMRRIPSAAMELSALQSWEAPEDWLSITVIDSHTGGEPFRLVVDGLPEIEGETVLARRRYAQDHLDDYRKLLMWEPRGHADMYGGWIGSPTTPGSDLSVLFLHNEGFSTMCGHGIIALTKVVLDTGVLAATGEDETTIRIDTPAGQITSVATVVNGIVSAVRFRNVPSFVELLEGRVEVSGIGEVNYDLAYGGAYYAYVDALRAGLSWPTANQSELVEIGRRIKAAILAERQITHPEHGDLGFLYGVIFSGSPTDPENDYRNVCVFADGEIDRSPTGTGVSGRLAIEAARQRITIGDSLRIESVVGSVFTGHLADEITYHGRPAVIPEIEGHAFITGKSTYYIDPSDPIKRGFLIR